MDLSKMSDSQVSSFANALARLINDLEKGEDSTVQSAAADDTQAVEIKAAQEIERIRCRLTGYQQAYLRCGASQPLQMEIVELKNQLMTIGQAPQPYELMPSGWVDNSNNPRLELACRRAEQEALMRIEAPLEEQIRCMDRIKQLEMMTGYPLK